VVFTQAEIVLSPSKTQPPQIRFFPFPTFNTSFHLTIPLYQALPKKFFCSLRDLPTASCSPPRKYRATSANEGQLSKGQQYTHLGHTQKPSPETTPLSISPFKNYHQIHKRAGTRGIKHQHLLNIHDHPRKPFGKRAYHIASFRLKK
jgi:hypothetical protein